MQVAEVAESNEDKAWLLRTCNDNEMDAAGLLFEKHEVTALIVRPPVYKYCLICIQ